MIDLANELDQRPTRDDYSLLAAIHHHPIPVERPEWHHAPFYERLLGKWFEETECLEDSAAFLDFAANQEVKAILHGHKHIPRLARTPGSKIPVVGCGSSVGKVQTVDGNPLMSLNVVTVDHSTGQLAARLLASETAGGRLGEYSTSQAVMTAPL